MLHCLPFSPNDFDTHVVSIVYISDLGKWIMLDASNNRFFIDSDNNILSPMEIRSRLACNDDIECNVSDDNYKRYMAKNMFYFKSLHRAFFSFLAHEIISTAIGEKIALEGRLFVIAGHARLKAAVRRFDVAVAVIDADNDRLVSRIHKAVHHKFLSAAVRL